MEEKHSFFAWRSATIPQDYCWQILKIADRLYAKTDMIFTKQECSVEKKETDWSILRLGFVNDYQGPKSGLGSIWETGRGEKHAPRLYLIAVSRRVTNKLPKITFSQICEWKNWGLIFAVKYNFARSGGGKSGQNCPSFGRWKQNKVHLFLSGNVECSI